MKWLFYVIVFIYMLYRAVYGARNDGLVIDPVNYGDDDFLKVGDHKAISCKPINKNQKVEWVDPNDTVVKRTSKGRVFSQEHFAPTPRGRVPALILTITNAVVADTGVYQCRSGDLTKNVSLCVIDPSQFLETPTEVTVDVGRSITLSCQLKGDPEPRVEWNRNGETIIDEDSSGKYKVMTKYNIQGFEGQLTITSLEAEDSGIYSCVSIQENNLIENCSHTKTQNLTLNVKSPPTFDDSNAIIYGTINEEVKIVCSAKAYPLPTYRVFKELVDGTLLELNEKQINFVEGNQAIHTVKLSLANLGTKFKCQATNEYGSSEQYITLMETPEPKAIDEVALIDTSNDTVQLLLTWNDDVDYPIDAILMQYIQVHNDDNTVIKEAAWRRSNKFRVQLDEENQPSSEGIKVTLNKLNMDSSYWIRVCAWNQAGYSPWSEPILVSTDEESITAETQEPVPEYNMSDSSFYGIFFAGGILVVAFVCMFAMKLVK